MLVFLLKRLRCGIKLVFQSGSTSLVGDLKIEMDTFRNAVDFITPSEMIVVIDCGSFIFTPDERTALCKKLLVVMNTQGMILSVKKL